MTKNMTNKENIGRDAILTTLTLMRSKDPMDYFYVKIIGVYDEEKYIIIADRRDREFIVDEKDIKII